MSPITDETIGANIRAVRTKLNVTVTALAERTALNKSTISKIETGRVSPPVSTLARIAQALNVPLAEFLAEPDADPPFVLTRKGEGKPITRDGTRFGYSYEALALEMRHKRVEPFLFTISPGDPPAKGRHAGQEFIYMLSGQVAFSVGDRKMKLMPGDALYYDATCEHVMRLVGKRPARFLVISILGEEKTQRARRT